MTNAGYEIIARCGHTVEDYSEGVALGVADKPYIGKEWVTWEYTERPDEPISYYWGHYIHDEQEARKDYYNRATNQLRRLSND